MAWVEEVRKRKKTGCDTEQNEGSNARCKMKRQRVPSESDETYTRAKPISCGRADRTPELKGMLEGCNLDCDYERSAGRERKNLMPGHTSDGMRNLQEGQNMGISEALFQFET